MSAFTGYRVFKVFESATGSNGSFKLLFTQFNSVHNSFNNSKHKASITSKGS